MSKNRKRLKKPIQKGEILKALRRSPLVGAKLNLRRPVVPGRSAELKPGILRSAPPHRS